jgi:hypothetical protein
MLAQCPQLAAHLQVFTEAFILAMRPTGSSCLVIRASDMLSRVLRLSLSFPRLNNVLRKGSRSLNQVI